MFGGFTKGVIYFCLIIYCFSILRCGDNSVNTGSGISLAGVWQLKQRSGGFFGQTIKYTDNPRYLLLLTSDNKFTETKNDSIVFTDYYSIQTDSPSKKQYIIFKNSNRTGMMIDKLTADSLILNDRMMDGYTSFYVRIN